MIFRCVWQITRDATMSYLPLKTTGCEFDVLDDHRIVSAVRKRAMNQEVQIFCTTGSSFPEMKCFGCHREMFTINWETGLSARSYGGCGTAA